MIKFKQHLTESKEGKNVHLEHIEDLVFNEGVTGTRRAILFLRSVRDMLSGSSSKSVNITTKWDGAPAIFAGVDPEDGKFFVAKKGLFNINPQMFKSVDDINLHTQHVLRNSAMVTGAVDGANFFIGEVDLENFVNACHVSVSLCLIHYNHYTRWRLKVNSFFTILEIFFRAWAVLLPHETLHRQSWHKSFFVSLYNQYEQW